MKRLLATILAAFVVAAIGAGIWLVHQLNQRPGIDPYRHLFLGGEGAPHSPLTVTFFGVSTLLFDDGETAIMSDGFFTRPGLAAVVFGRITPDPALIAQSLARAGVERLAAVIPLHSHYDHAMDAPEVARQTGAILVGSASTANIGRGWGLDEDRIHVVRGQETLRFGSFQVTLVPTVHIPHGIATGHIEQPLIPPVRAHAYREGESYSLIIEHKAGSFLVQGGGFIPGALDRHRVDVALIGTGGMTRQGETYQQAYWDHVVRAVKPRRVIAVHWDDFTLPLDRPLEPLPGILTRFDQAMEFLLARAQADGIELSLIPAWIPVDPLAGLREESR